MNNEELVTNNDAYYSLFYNQITSDFKVVDYYDDSFDDQEDYKLLMMPLPHDFILSFLEHYDTVKGISDWTFDKVKSIFLEYFVSYGFAPPHGERDVSISMPVTDWCNLVVVGKELAKGMTFEQYSMNVFRQLISTIEDRVVPDLNSKEGTDVIKSLIYDTYIYALLGNDPIDDTDIVKSFQYNHAQKMFHFASDSDLTHNPGWIELGRNVPIDKAQGYADLYYDHVLDHESERMVRSVFHIWMSRK